MENYIRPNLDSEGFDTDFNTPIEQPIVATNKAVVNLDEVYEFNDSLVNHTARLVLQADGVSIEFQIEKDDLTLLKQEGIDLNKVAKDSLELFSQSIGCDYQTCPVAVVLRSPVNFKPRAPGF